MACALKRHWARARMSDSQPDLDSTAGGGEDGMSAGAATATASRPPGAAPPKRELDRILHLSVPVAVTLAERPMSIESILSLTVGSIIEFDVSFEADLTLSVADRPIGSGLAVKVGENFGLRLSTVGSVHDRIDALGGA